MCVCVVTDTLLFHIMYVFVPGLTASRQAGRNVRYEIWDWLRNVFKDQYPHDTVLLKLSIKLVACSDYRKNVIFKGVFTDPVPLKTLHTKRLKNELLNDVL